MYPNPTIRFSAYGCGRRAAYLKRPFRLLRSSVAFVVAGALCLGLISCCSHNMRPSPLRDINAVLADHDKELLAIPGVVGVYVGLLSDQKTQCLKVMLKRED